MCKCLIKPYLDYDDITYDQDYNLTFHRKLSLVQQNTTLARQLAVG